MAAEERFSRKKHDSGLPTQAFRNCLKQAGIHPGQIDCIAYYELPEKKLARQLSQGLAFRQANELSWFDCRLPLHLIRECWGYSGRLICYPHHLSHAASSFYFSGLQDAAVLVVDGVGEWDTLSYGKGSGAGLEIFEAVRFPHSLGLWYAAITAYLGFRVNNGEYKVMGLAPYGEPRYLAQMRDMVRSLDGPGLELNMAYFDYVSGSSMFSEEMERRLGQPARRSHEEVTGFHCDVAKSLQVHLEDILMEKAGYLHRQVGSKNLCLAGGVALNCVANGKLHREGPFENVFVQPAAGDDGGCLGAAALAQVTISGEPPGPRPMNHVFWGPGYSNRSLKRLLDATGCAYEDFQDREADLEARMAAALESFKIIGWFHGRMEMGPRALGSRSILANPMDPEIRDRLNAMVKKRESFRPFAPSVLETQSHHHFQLNYPSRFMLETCQVRSSLDLPGITHVDGSARPQTVTSEASPRFAALIAGFHRKTGCPLLVNTSFNLRGEPIVCTPQDALRCAIRANIDFLVLGDFVLELGRTPQSWSKLADYWPGPDRHLERTGENHHLYTFV